MYTSASNTVSFSEQQYLCLRGDVFSPRSITLEVSPWWQKLTRYINYKQTRGENDTTRAEK